MSFVNVGEGYISQLQFTEYYRNAVEPFLTVLSDNSINDGDISSVEMGNLLPLEYCEPRIEELLYGSQEQEEPSQSFDINIGEVIPPTDIPEDEDEEEMTIFSESDAVEFDEKEARLQKKFLKKMKEMKIILLKKSQIQKM